MRWSTITGISNSAAGRATILTPFVGQYLILNDAVREHLSKLQGETSGIIFGQFEFGASQSLYLTYFGLFAVGVGIILHQIFCPPEFKRFSEPTEYANYFMLDFTPQKIEQVRAKWAPSLDKLPMDDTYLSTADAAEKREALSSRIKRYQDEIFDILRTAYDNGDKSRELALWPSVLLVFGGLVVTFIPSLITFYRVAKQFLFAN